MPVLGGLGSGTTDSSSRSVCHLHERMARAPPILPLAIGLGHSWSVSVEPTWPIFCLDGADVIVVEAPSDVPIELDPVLVDEPVTLVDAAGRLLKKVVSQPKRRRWRLFENAPEILGVEVVHGEDATDTLRRALVAYLEASGICIEDSDDIETFAREAARHIH